MTDAEVEPTPAIPAVDRRATTHPGNAALRDAFPTLVDEWRAYWREQPWHRGRDGDGPDAVLDVLRAILDTAMAEHGGQKGHERLLRASVAHGRQRQHQGASEETLLGEYHALRKALWRHLLTSAPMTENLTTICRVDIVISAASGLALRGYMSQLVAVDFPWERELARTMAAVSEGLVRALG